MTVVLVSAVQESSGILREGGSMDAATSVLLTDLYQLNMMQAYLDRGETKAAVFEFFVRKLPRDRGFLIAAGLEQVLGFFEQFRFTREELVCLGNTGRFGIPIFGTMAHCYIQIHDDETQAFENFARARPKNLILLIDTYDTEAAARKVVALAPKLKAAGISIAGVRLDSGDLIALSNKVRRILDDGGLTEVTIFASGGIDETVIRDIIRSCAPIDGFG